MKRKKEGTQWMATTHTHTHTHTHTLRHETQVLLKKRMREQSHSKKRHSFDRRKKRNKCTSCYALPVPFPHHQRKDTRWKLYLEEHRRKHIYIMQQLQILAIKNYQAGKGYMWLVRQPSHSII